MNLFGKILLVLNLLAAGGFVYLATQDWKGRQNINAVGLRYQLLIAGLPLDGPANFDSGDMTPFRIEGPGGVPTQTVSKKLLEVYFQAAPGGDALGGGGPVPNQLAEARRVRAKIEETLDRAENDANRVQLLKDWLILQVETYEERLEVQSLAQANNVEALKAKLLARFDAVIDAPKAVDAEAIAAVKEADLEGKSDEEKAQTLDSRLTKSAESRIAPLDEGERKVKLAHLLAHLSTDAAWQKRVMVVVGLQRYVRSIAAQALRFNAMAQRVSEDILADQRSFFEQVANQADTARTATEETNRQASLRNQWIEQATKEKDFVAQRDTHLTDLKNQLIKLKTEVDSMLAKQATIEAGLFEIQREVAITLDEVFQFEADLAERERKLLEANKK